MDIVFKQPILHNYHLADSLLLDSYSLSQESILYCHHFVLAFASILLIVFFYFISSNHCLIHLPFRNLLIIAFFFLLSSQQV